MNLSLARIGYTLAWAGILVACASASSQVTLADDAPAKTTDTATPPSATPLKAETAVKPAKTATKKAVAAAAVISTDREAAAMEFAQQNHPELVSLLQGLKTSAPKEYQAALLDLDRAADRLSKIKDKSSDRYEFQLTDWKMSSRIRLFAARLAVENDPTLETELRTALRNRIQLRLSAQRADRDRLQKRLEKMDQLIDEQSTKMDAQVEKQFSDLRKTVTPAKRATKAKPKRPAAESPAETTEQK